MQGIDISSYQAGIDLAAVPCDFAIVKATEGTGYVNPDCDRAMQQLFSLGKCAGVYHYINGSDGEIDYFIDNIAGYIGRAVICLDWESGGNSQWGNLDYLGGCIDRVKERTGITPIVYASSSAFPWDLCAAKNCGTWVAQYADMNPTGYQDDPWNSDAYSCTIRQYSSSGQLDNWGGSLDLDLFYGDASAWAAYAGNSEDDLNMNSNEILQDWWNGIDGHSGMYTNVIDTNIRIQEVQTTLAAQAEAIKTLAQAKGGDPDQVAQAVSDAVAAKLKSLHISVND